MNRRAPSMPQAIKVGHLNFRVDIWTQAEADAEAALGKCVPVDERIWIIGNISPRAQAETLLHELLHACWYVQGLPVEGGVEEERAVNGLSLGLASVLSDNPKLRAYLMAVLA